MVVTRQVGQKDVNNVFVDCDMVHNAIVNTIIVACIPLVVF